MNVRRSWGWVASLAGFALMLPLRVLAAPAVAVPTSTQIDLPKACADVAAESPMAPDLVTPVAELRKQVEVYFNTSANDAVNLLCNTIPRVQREFGADSAEIAWWVGSLATPLIAYMDRFDEALPLLDFAQPIFERELGPYSAEVADIHVAHAWIYFRQGRMADAGDAWERALTAREHTPGEGKIELQKALVGLAQVRLSQRQFAASEAALLRAKAILVEQNETVSPAASAIENAFTNLYLRQEDYVTARAHAEAQVAIEQQITDGNGQPVPAYVMLGQILERLAEFEDSEAALRTALSRAEAADAPLQRHQLAALTQLSEALSARGRPQEALTFAEQALALAESNIGANAPRMVRMLDTLGEIQRTLGDLPAAMSYYARATSVAEAQAQDVEKPSLIRHYRGAAELAITLGEHDEARQLLGNALDAAGDDRTVSTERAATLLVAAQLNGTASRADRTQTQQRRADLEQALTLTRTRLPDAHPAVARIVNGLCAVEIDESPGGSGTPYCSDALARLAADNGMSPAIRAALYDQQSEQAERAGDATLAVDHATRALAAAATLGTPEPLWRSYFRLAALLTQSATVTTAPPAIATATAPTTAATAATDATASTAAAATPAAAAAGATPPANSAIANEAIAIFLGKQSIAEIERLRAYFADDARRFDPRFLADKISVYRTVADWLMGVGRIDEGLSVLSLMKGEELYDFVLRDADSGADSDAPRVALTDAEQALQQQLQAVLSTVQGEGAEIDRLSQLREAGRISVREQQRLDELSTGQGQSETARAGRIKQLLADAGIGPASSTAPSSGDRQPTPRPVDVPRAVATEQMQSIRAPFGDGAALAVYLLTPERLRIVLATRQGVTDYDIPMDTVALQRRIGTFLDDIGRQADVSDTAHQLYEQLIAPIDAAARTAGITHLVLWLDGALRYVPFDALWDGQQQLIDRYAVQLYSDPLRGQAELPRPQALVGKTVSVAQRHVRGMGVTEALGGFAPLPGMAEELCQVIRGPIAGLRQVGRGCAAPEQGNGAMAGLGFANAAFTEARLNETLNAPRDFSVLHLGTHFSLRPGNALRSYLLLGDGERLSLDRISHLDFGHLALVTLSACQTGFGGVSGSDGREIDGLSAIVQRRGAERVVASLWKVSDESTAQLMSTLYQGIKAEDSDTAASLRTAKLALRDQRRLFAKPYVHPYYWAGFFVAGAQP